MKIALLMQYERFEQIITSTLSSALSSLWGKTVSVRWRDANILDRLPLKHDSYLVVPELNAIFRPDADRIVFETIWDEYGDVSFSCDTLRAILEKPARATYIVLSTVPPISMFFSPYRLEVYPDLSGTPSKYLIIGGTYRIRIIDRGSQLVFSVLKSGASPETMQAEIQLRRSLSWLPAPPLIDYNPEKAIVTESFIRGKAIDRIRNLHIWQESVREISNVLNRLRSVEIGVIQVSDLINCVKFEMEQCRLPRDWIRRFTGGISHINSYIGTGDIETCISHGDLQPGNILYTPDKGFVFIDWETTAHRSPYFDPLTFWLKIRQGKGIYQSTKRFIEQGGDDSLAVLLGNLNSDISTLISRKRIISIHLIEQLLYYLREQRSSLFTKLGPGLSSFQRHWDSLISLL